VLSWYAKGRTHTRIYGCLSQACAGQYLSPQILRKGEREREEKTGGAVRDTTCIITVTIAIIIINLITLSASRISTGKPSPIPDCRKVWAQSGEGSSSGP